MKKLNLFLMLGMLGFGMMVVQTAQAGPASITQAPCEGLTNDNNASLPVFVDGGNCGAGPNWNSRIAIAPYAQVVANDSYTFIGISHPSLASAHTSIGVVVEALNMTTVPNTSAGRAAVFTVSAGETHRVFVINQSHATINLNNSAFTDTQTHLITTTDGGNFGNIKVTGIHTHPSFATTEVNRPGGYRTADPLLLLRHDNVSQLAMWGVVYQTSNGAGFALEFIGDMHDSSVAGNFTVKGVQEAVGNTILLTNTSGAGRGVN